MFPPAALERVIPGWYMVTLHLYYVVDESRLGQSRHNTNLKLGLQTSAVRRGSKGKDEIEKCEERL